MEGSRSNFDAVLSDFEATLAKARFVAIDLEMTGTHIEGEPDSYMETAEARFDKLCRIAELHEPVQLGLTLISEEPDRYKCSTYNIYMFSPERNFLCKASALKFISDNGMDFNAWIREGVGYMTREEEDKCKSLPDAAHEMDSPANRGLLGLWKSLCDAKLPLVLHGPLDLFFLFRCFERAELPRDLAEFSSLVHSRFRCVFDTAQLHREVQRFRSGKLFPFLDEAKELHSRLELAGQAKPCRFDLSEATQAKYGPNEGRSHAHEAGCDSLATAQVFVFLRTVMPDAVQRGVDRLYLHKSPTSLDLRDPRTQQVSDQADAVGEEEGTFTQANAAPTNPVESDTEGGERFIGTIKTFSETTGYGFIVCQATFDKFRRDVWLHSIQLAQAGLDKQPAGEQVSFEVELNGRGQPQARKVRPLPECRAPRLPSSSCAKANGALAAAVAAASAAAAGAFTGSGNGGNGDRSCVDDGVSSFDSRGRPTSAGSTAGSAKSSSGGFASDDERSGSAEMASTLSSSTSAASSSAPSAAAVAAATAMPVRRSVVPMVQEPLPPRPPPTPLMTMQSETSSAAAAAPAETALESLLLKVSLWED